MDSRIRARRCEAASQIRRRFVQARDTAEALIAAGQTAEAV
jgi:hypothetical protein